MEVVLDEVDLAYSRFRPDSEVRRVAARPGRTAVVSSLLARAVETALRAARISDGLVDPTVGRTLRAIGYDDDFDRVAARSGPIEIRVQAASSWRAIRFDSATRRLTLPPGVELDLGSTGKALASDIAAAAVADMLGPSVGILVSLGGDIATAGPAPAGGWRIRVAEDSSVPSESDGEVLAIDAGAVATSSTTVRRWVRRNRPAPYRGPPDRSAGRRAMAHGDGRGGHLRRREHRCHGVDRARPGRPDLARGDRPAGPPRVERGPRVSGSLAGGGRRPGRTRELVRAPAGRRPVTSPKGGFAQIQPTDTAADGGPDSMSMQILWFATRGAGIVSLLLFTAVVCLGVLTVVRWQSPTWPRFLTVGVHRNLALLSMVFLGIHIGTAVLDPFTHLGWLAAVVPMASSYRPLWVAMGVVSVDLSAAVILTSLLRDRIGQRTWRAVHWLAYGSWPLALVHSLGAGSDAFALWMAALSAACVAAVVCAVTWRLLAGHSNHTGLAAVVDRSSGPRGSAARPAR